MTLNPPHPIQILPQQVRYFRPFAHNPDDTVRVFFCPKFFKREVYPDRGTCSWKPQAGVTKKDFIRCETIRIYINRLYPKIPV